MLLSDHFVISFDLLLRKSVREKKKIISRNIRAIDMHNFRTDVHILLRSCTQSNSTDPICVYNTCLRTVFTQFQLVTEDFVKTIVQKLPKKSCNLDAIPTSFLYDCLDEVIPILVLHFVLFYTSVHTKSCNPTCPPQVQACKCNSTAQNTPLASSEG